MNIEKLKEAGIVSIRDELLKLQADGRQIARLESGDPAFSVFPEVREAMIDAINNGNTHYTPGAGIWSLRAEVAKKVRRENSIICAPEWVFITAGAMNGLYVVYRSLIDMYGKDKEILVPTPTWTETITNVKLAGGTRVYYNMPTDGAIDMAELESLINKNTIAMVINTPHNPTGAVISPQKIKSIVDFCRDHNIYLISDEAYEHIVYPGAKHFSPASIGATNKTISIFSCSKSYAMSGLRVGFVVSAHKELRNIIKKYIRCTVNGVNSVAQYGALEALSREHADRIESMVAEYFYRRELLYDALCKCSFLEPVKPAGAFYVWARIRDWDEREKCGEDGWSATAQLIEHGIGSAPGECFGPGGPGYLRFSFSCPTTHIKFAAEKLRDL